MLAGVPSWRVIKYEWKLIAMPKCRTKIDISAVTTFDKWNCNFAKIWIGSQHMPETRRYIFLAPFLHIRYVVNELLNSPVTRHFCNEQDVRTFYFQLTWHWPQQTVSSEMLISNSAMRCILGLKYQKLRKWLNQGKCKRKLERHRISHKQQRQEWQV